MSIYQSHALDLLRNCLSVWTWQIADGGCNSENFIKKALFMPRLVIRSHDLHWHWLNWTLLCDTMEVSMLRLAWLTITQHVFQPALTGRLELIVTKNCLLRTETKAIAVSEFRKNCLLWIGSKKLPRFREKYLALGHQKMGSNMRQRYIQFRDIHDRDISAVHCNGLSFTNMGTWINFNLSMDK